MLPALDVQQSTVTLALSGLVQEQVMVEGVPTSTVPGFAVQEICGGFSGFTVKLAVQLAVLFFLALGSVTVAVVVLRPAPAPLFSIAAPLSFPSLVSPLRAPM